MDEEEVGLGQHIMVYFQSPVEGDSLWSCQSIAFEHSIAGIFSHGICRSQKRVVARTSNSKFEFFGWLFLCRSLMLQSGENAGVPNDYLADKWTIWILSSHWP